MNKFKKYFINEKHISHWRFGILGASLSNLLNKKGNKVFILTELKRRKLLKIILIKKLKKLVDILKIYNELMKIIKSKINLRIHLGAITQVIDTEVLLYLKLIFLNVILEAVRIVNVVKCYI